MWAFDSFQVLLRLVSNICILWAFVIWAFDNFQILLRFVNNFYILWAFVVWAFDNFQILLKLVSSIYILWAFVMWAFDSCVGLWNCVVVQWLSHFLSYRLRILHGSSYGQSQQITQNKFCN